MTTSPTGAARLAGVMGWPVTHSLSPRLHSYWLAHYGIDGMYMPLPVNPTQLKEALAALPVLGFRGVNLTIPHKEIALSFVHELDPLARRAGAANTIIVREDGRLIGRNTDVFGFSENLRTQGFVPPAQGFSATVLGAGGAARAVCVALQDMGAVNLHIVARDASKAEGLCASLGGGNSFSVYEWEKRQDALEGAHLLVNATSLGMKGQPALDIDLSPLPSSAFVTDVVYAPLETPLLAAARQKGLKAIDGLGMLLYQAAPGFEAWFGRAPTVTDELRAHVLKGLAA